MKQIVIEGNKLLSGTVKIGGAKNSVVGLIPAALLSSGTVKITNVPNISDKDALILIMEELGAKIKHFDSEIIIDSSNVKNACISLELCKKLRASYYFMGILLTKYKHVEIYLPGGCEIGTRPIDFHIKGFEALGAKITNEGDKFILNAENLTGANINLDMPSVGATINIMFAAVMAKGTTVINNAAKEPEISNIAELLRSMGAIIEGDGSSVIKITGVTNLADGSISVCPDRIEAGTYAIVGALLGNDFQVEGVNESHIKSLLNNFEKMNIKYTVTNNILKINKANNMKPFNIKSEVFPDFPTDLGQPMHVLLSMASGKSVFEETIYENRMGHIKYLNKMGANIKAGDTTAEIVGPTNYVGQSITAGDLRGGAALVLAGLVAEGITTIKEVDHILRGYENIIRKLTKVGANIKIIEI